VPIREDAPREPSSIYGLTNKIAEDWIMFYGIQLPMLFLGMGTFMGRVRTGAL
jgi:nucleoside-diphosphate-sugar epimerase